MKALLTTTQKWIAANKQFAIATVTKTWGSAPRRVGSSMIVSADKEIAGSVSGGCIEGAVIKTALTVIETGESQRLSFGVSDEDAWEVGLSCGGKIEVFVERAMVYESNKQKIWNALSSNLSNNQACILITELVDGATRHCLSYPDGTMLGHNFGEAVQAKVISAYNERKTQCFEIEEQQYLAQVFPRKSQLLIIGAAHITVDLVQLANLYNFETIVIDPRGAFTNKMQFEKAPDQLFEKYPAEVLDQFELDHYTYAVVLSHDPKIDDNALHILLPSKVAYIGALGSRKTQAKRVARLTAAGFSEEAISKIHAPIGIGINAKTPKEIALSIMAELIKIQNTYL